ncbi:UDP-N-acetylglucosamine 1-carboxyvinyltransferase [Thermovirga lienii]|uniref:UDP-N-acetylglucosamine 1-carboxyvinyltransferase n=1 Tax=Thermovirga lienii TaxID=336261 RepID=UPI000EC00F48|nr:UDP-N-acetylglucosamine 1-carboxyvinyltransferase [Thermovirga lienii]
MYSKMLIKGGNPLSGEVTTQGAKNAALPVIAASLLLKGKRLKIKDVPKLEDIYTMADLLRQLGVEVNHVDHSMILSVPEDLCWETPKALVSKMRASSLVLGPLLARMGKAVLPLPGGCAIGSRPIDLHLKGLVKLGAEVELLHGAVHVKAKELRGTRIYLDFPSVGATENIMMAAVFAKGETVIENAAREPEITNLAEALKLMGCNIEGVGTGIIHIEGTDSLEETEVKIIPDRIEAGTYMVAGAITRGKVKVKNVTLEHIDATLAKLEETGVTVEVEKDAVTVDARDCKMKGVSLKTLPYPGFPTDMQPQFTALLTIAEGTSVIKETIFESRFLHVSELKRMGADIELQGNTAIVNGVPKLKGAEVRATDLRAGAALVLAGLAAEDETVVYGLGHIRRGYEDFQNKLKALGGDVEELPSEEDGSAKW